MVDGGSIPPLETANSRPSFLKPVLVAGLVNIVSILPVFLVGALAVQLQEDLAFGAVGLGIAVAAYRVAGAVLMPLLGRLVDRLGAIASIRLSVLIAAITYAMIAFVVSSWAALVAWLMLGGCAQAIGSPAANRMVANGVQPRRLGTAFGLKQSAPPLGSMLAGLSVPLVALAHGWRVVFAGGIVIGIVLLVVAGRRHPRAKRVTIQNPPARDLDARWMILQIAIAFGLGTASSSAVTTFYVTASVQAGSSQEFAGMVLAIASVAAISVRIGAGVVSDRVAAGHLRGCAGLLTLGSIGLMLLATQKAEVMAAGTLLALAGTWGFNGMYFFALMRAFPDIPGRITGLVAPGAMVGSSIGPIVFGTVVTFAGHSLAWLITSVMTLCGATVMYSLSPRLDDRIGSVDRQDFRSVPTRGLEG